MNNLEKVKQEINNYQEEFKKSKEYLDLKQKDFALYKDKNLLPYFKQKEKIEEDIKYLIPGSKEFEQKLIDYQNILNKLKESKTVKEYIESYNNLLKIKKLIEDKLLKKLYE